MNTYRTLPWPPVRNLIREQMDIAAERHNIHGLFDLDITLLTQQLKEKRKEGAIYSFTACMLYYLAQTLNTQKELLAMKWGNKRILFEDIDLLTIVERKMKEGPSVPVALIIRAANKKSLDELNSELRKAQKQPILEIEGVAERRKLLRFPSFIRRFLLWRIHRNPFLFKKYYGNAAVTSLNFFSGSRTWYGIPLTASPVCLLPGGSFKKVVMQNGIPVERDFCTFTISIDHDGIDGGPATRFVRAFAEMVEGAYGL